MFPATLPTRSARLASVLGTLAIALAACGGGTSTTPPPSQAATQGAATPGASAAPSGGSAPAAFSLEAKEYSFTPATLSAPAGELTFNVRNAGTEDHEFEVYQDIAQSLGKAEAFGVGETGTLTVTLPAGEYTFACRLNGHHLLGMTGTLTVE